MRAVQAVILLTAALARPSDAFLPSAKLRLRSSQLLHVRSLRGGSTILEEGSENIAEIDRLLDRVTQTSASQPIILQWKNNPLWLWQQVKGTVLEVTWEPLLFNVLAGLMLVVCHSTFSWSSLRLIGRVPTVDLVVLGLVSIVTVWRNLAVAVAAGTLSLRA